MSEQHQNRSSKPLNANLVALIFIINFVVIAGLIVANTPLLSTEVSGEEERIEVALQEPTATLPQPSNTPLPPTSTPTSVPPTSTPLPPTSTPTEIPASDTPQAVADAGQAAGTDDSSYDPALVTQGETLFPQCAACHGPDARGIPNLGKDLVDSEFVAAQTDDELVQFIIMGRPIWDPENTTGIDMPPKGGNPALSTDDIHAIVAYLRILSAHDAPETETEPASDTPQAVEDTDQTASTDDSNYDPALVTQGETLFPQCAACHGPDARGIPNLGKDLVDSEFVSAQTDDALVQFIIMGRPIWDPENTSGIDMPPKGGNPALSTDDIHAIVAYLRSLADNGE